MSKRNKVTAEVSKESKAVVSVFASILQTMVNTQLHMEETILRGETTLTALEVDIMSKAFMDGVRIALALRDHPTIKLSKEECAKGIAFAERWIDPDGDMIVPGIVITTTMDAFNNGGKN